jgi:hypothetical protein
MSEWRLGNEQNSPIERSATARIRKLQHFGRELRPGGDEFLELREPENFTDP